MKMKHYLWMLQLLPLLTVLVAWPATSAALRADLTHADSGRGFTRRELLRRMVVRSRARAAKLCPSGRPVTTPVVLSTDEIGSNEYLMHLHIGTPRPQHVALNVDTGSDLIWTQCQPCFKCFPQNLPALDTSTSSTVHGVACSDPLCQNLPTHQCFIRGCIYAYGYGDKSLTIGQLAKDSFTFQGKGGSTVSVPDLAFGCGMYTTGKFLPNETGIAGFGRGPWSLPSQLKVGKFSYCFTPILEPTSSGPVFLGAPDDLKAHATGPILSTPFVRNPPDPPELRSRYYLSLKGVTVGKTRLPVPESAFALKANGSGGTIIDSGTAITLFPRAILSHLRSTFVSQMPLPSSSSGDDDKNGGLQCFSTASVPDASKVPVPKLVFHLEGADWELPRDNYMAEDDDSRQLCLIIAEAGDDGMTIIGNFQQQNMHIVYDLAGSKLVIVPAQCDKM